MCIITFQTSLRFIKQFAFKLQYENLAFPIQKVMLKAYARSLGMNLTEKMLEELLLF